MQLEILKCIAAYVLKNGAVSIPGIGYLYTQFDNEEFTKQEGFLHPPRKILTFDTNHREDGHFISHLASVFNVSIERASQLIDEFSQSLKNSLTSGKSVKIPGVGSLKADDEQLYFEAIDGNFHEDYLFYPSIPLVPVMAEKEKIEPKLVPAEKVGKVSAIHRVDMSAPITKTGIDSSKSITMENTNNRKDPYYDDDKGLFSEIGSPLLLLLLFALFAFFAFKTGCFGLYDKSKSMATEVIDTVSDTADDVVEQATDAISGDSNTQDGYTGKYSDVLTQDIIDQGCVIVVGSFKNPKNALRMRNRIISKGYQPFDEYHNGLNRIGLVFNCLEVDLVDFIQSVRRDIDPKAWYRIPGFEVAYAN